MTPEERARDIWQTVVAMSNAGSSVAEVQHEILLSINAAVAAEREACAKIADPPLDRSEFGLASLSDETQERLSELRKRIAARIRARGAR